MGWIDLILIIIILLLCILCYHLIQLHYCYLETIINRSNFSGKTEVFLFIKIYPVKSHNHPGHGTPRLTLSFLSSS